MRRHGGRSVKKERAKDFKSTLKKMLNILKPYRFKFVFVVFFALGATVLSVIGPKVLGSVTTLLFEGLVDSVAGVGSIDFNRVIKVISTLVLIYGLSFVFSVLQGFIMTKISRDLTFNLRKSVHQKLNHLPLSYYDKKTTGEILSYMTNDIDAMSSNFADSITQVITSFTSLIGILFMMFGINVLMTLVNLIVLPLSFGVVAIIMKRSQKHFVAHQQNLSTLNGHIEEIYSNQNIVKAYNGEKQAITQFEKENSKLYHTAWKSQFFSGMMQPIMQFIGNFSYVIIAILGGTLATLKRISVGDIQSFVQYTRNFMQPIRQLSSITNVFQSSLAAAERVFEFLEEPEEAECNDVKIDLNSIKGEVIFENVHFGYDPKKPVIHNFNQVIKPGSQIAIVGPTGAGKTTIVKLLMRFYDVIDGSIKIDGININDMRRSDLRSLVGMVLQDTWLYQGSILENIRYGNLEASDEAVMEAAKKAQLDHFILSLPDGFDMILNEETSNVSQGQKQLLTIARAILSDPIILILDEATSSVDTRTESLIQKAMDVLMKDRTTFVIAHRLSTIRNADLILVMNHGDIVESGTHQALLDANGFYATLYNSQFQEGVEL